MVCLCRERGQNLQWGLAGGEVGGATVTQGFQLFTKGALWISFIWSEIPSRVKTDVSERLKVDSFLASEGLRRFLGAPV